MHITKIICRLRRLLIYVFKEIPILLLMEIWTIFRVLTTMLLVGYIALNGFSKNDMDAYILSFFK